jgi:hypothetical protein
MISGILVLCLLALIILFVFIKMLPLLDPAYDLEDEQNSPINNDSFKTGLNQGLFIAFMSLYKKWIEDGESMLVGTFDDFRIELDQNIAQFFSDNNKMKEWNDKIIKHIEAQKEPPKP